jgi:Glycosyl hydrolase family 20, catalytic domain/beta-acetyl hexosaminidase like
MTSLVKGLEIMLNGSGIPMVSLKNSNRPISPKTFLIYGIASLLFLQMYVFLSVAFHFSINKQIKFLSKHLFGSQVSPFHINPVIPDLNVLEPRIRSLLKEANTKLNVNQPVWKNSVDTDDISLENLVRKFTKTSSFQDSDSYVIFCDSESGESLFYDAATDKSRPTTTSTRSYLKSRVKKRRQSTPRSLYTPLDDLRLFDLELNNSVSSALDPWTLDQVYALHMQEKIAARKSSRGNVVSRPPSRAFVESIRFFNESIGSSCLDDDSECASQAYRWPLPYLTPLPSLIHAGDCQSSSEACVSPELVAAALAPGHDLRASVWELLGVPPAEAIRLRPGMASEAGEDVTLPPFIAFTVPQETVLSLRRPELGFLIGASARTCERIAREARLRHLQAVSLLLRHSADSGCGFEHALRVHLAEVSKAKDAGAARGEDASNYRTECSRGGVLSEDVKELALKVLENERARSSMSRRASHEASTGIVRVNVLSNDRNAVKERSGTPMSHSKWSTEVTSRIVAAAPRMINASMLRANVDKLARLRADHTFEDTVLPHEDMDEAYSLTMAGSGDSTILAASVFGALRGLNTLASVYGGFSLLPSNTRPRPIYAAIEALLETPKPGMEPLMPRTLDLCKDCAAAVLLSASLTRAEKEESLDITRSALEGTGNPFPLVILDRPWRPYRGLLLDVSRHFMPLASIFNTLDGMEMSGLNVMHLHVTDSQSWPLQLFTYPTLAETRSWVRNYTYSSEHIKEIVLYAANRNIRVIPEFDIPGHSEAFETISPDLILRCNAEDSYYQYCAKAMNSLKSTNASSNLFPHRILLGGDPEDLSDFASFYGQFSRKPFVTRGADWPDMSHCERARGSVMLNLFHEAALTVVASIMLEFSLLFPDSTLHMGADEVKLLCLDSSPTFGASTWAKRHLSSLTVPLNLRTSIKPKDSLLLQYDGTRSFFERRAILSFFLHQTISVGKSLSKNILTWIDSRADLIASENAFLVDLELTKEFLLDPVNMKISNYYDSCFKAVVNYQETFRESSYRNISLLIEIERYFLELEGELPKLVADQTESEFTKNRRRISKYRRPSFPLMTACLRGSLEFSEFLSSRKATNVEFTTNSTDLGYQIASSDVRVPLAWFLHPNLNDAKTDDAVLKLKQSIVDPWYFFDLEKVKNKFVTIPFEVILPFVTPDADPFDADDAFQSAPVGTVASPIGVGLQAWVCSHHRNSEHMLSAVMDDFVSSKRGIEEWSETTYEKRLKRLRVLVQSACSYLDLSDVSHYSLYSFWPLPMYSSAMREYDYLLSLLSDSAMPSSPTAWPLSLGSTRPFLGAEASMWTEEVSFRLLPRRIWTRAAVSAELAWSESIAYERYARSLHSAAMDGLGFETYKWADRLGSPRVFEPLFSAAMPRLLRRSLQLFARGVHASIKAPFDLVEARTLALSNLVDESAPLPALAMDELKKAPASIQAHNGYSASGSFDGHQESLQPVANKLLVLNMKSIHLPVEGEDIDYANLQRAFVTQHYPQLFHSTTNMPFLRSIGAEIAVVFLHQENANPDAAPAQNEFEFVVENKLDMKRFDSWDRTFIAARHNYWHNLVLPTPSLSSVFVLATDPIEVLVANNQIFPFGFMILHVKTLTYVVIGFQHLLKEPITEVQKEFLLGNVMQYCEGPCIFVLSCQTGKMAKKTSDQAGTAYSSHCDASDRVMNLLTNTGEGLELLNSQDFAWPDEFLAPPAVENYPPKAPSAVFANRKALEQFQGSHLCARVPTHMKMMEESMPQLCRWI